MNLLTVDRNILKKCAGKIWKVRKQARQGNKQVAMDLGQCMAKKERSKLPELQILTFIMVINQMLVSDTKHIFCAQREALYNNVRYWEEQIDFTEI